MTKKRYAKLTMTALTELVHEPTTTEEERRIMCQRIYKLPHVTRMPSIQKSYAQVWEESYLSKYLIKKKGSK